MTPTQPPTQPRGHAPATRTALSAACTLALLLVTSCTSHDGPTAETKAHLALTTWSPGDDAMQALLQGKLAVRDGCVVIEAPDGSVTVPAWPRSLVRWDDARAVLTYAGHDYAVGDAISAGGGGVTDVQPSDSNVEYPAACGDLANGTFFAVQVDSLG